MLETMAKIEIIGPKKFFYPVVGLLHQLGTIHLEDMSHQEDLAVRQMTSDEATEGSKNELDNLAIRLNGIMETIKSDEEKKEAQNALKVEAEYYKKVWHFETAELIKEGDNLVNELEEKARELANRKNDLELELTSVQRYVSIVEKIQPLAEQIITLEGFETVAFLLERKYKDTLAAIKEEMSSLTEDKFELVSADVDDVTTAALVIFNKEYSGPVHAFLADNVNEVRLPPEMKNRPFNEVVEEMNAKLEAIPTQLDDIKGQLKEVSSDWYHKIKAMTAAISDRLDELATVPKFGETDYTFVVQGWLPYKNFAQTKEQINKKFGEKVLVTQLELSHHDLEQAPVVIHNPKWAQPFEMIMKIVQPPKYGTIDPTPLIAIFFPLIFGFIIGDMGYALVIGIAATLMKRKFKGIEAAEAVCSIFQIGAVSGFLFGILFGEAFGDLLIKFHLIKPIILPFNIPGMVHHEGTHIVHLLGEHVVGHTTLPFGRELEFLLPFLFISIGVGLLHLGVGLVLGIMNAVKEKARKHVFEKAGLLTVLLGIVVIAVSMISNIPFLKSPAFILMAAGIIATVYGAGPLNALEHIFGTLANLFSYMRLIALAMAAVIMASVANNLGASFAEGGGFGIVIGIIMASMLHIINIIVASFSPTIHTIRLNVLEFFNRFYEPGGKNYKPFKARR